MYGKIFDSMYEGTLYGHWQAIVTLQQMLVLCNSDGVIDMTPQAISARTSIPLEIITKGIEVLAAPDPYSRTPGEDGKRILCLDEHRPWGWSIVNYRKYQQIRSRAEKLEIDRERIANKRKANNNNNVAKSSDSSPPVADVAPTTTTTTTTKETHSAFALPDWIPSDAWNAWLSSRKTKATCHAKVLAVRELSRLRDQGHDAKAVLEQSILRGWTGLFPLKNIPQTADWKEGML